MESLVDRLGASLQSAAGTYLTSGAIRAEVKTNLGPAVTIYSGSTGRPSLADQLGIKAALIIRDRDGKVIGGYGEPPATDPVMVAMAALTAAALGVVIYKLIRRI